MGTLDGDTAAQGGKEILGASRDQARRISGSLRERALAHADGHRAQLARGLHQLADSAHGQEHVEGPAGQLVGYAVSAAERAASALESSSAEELLARGSEQVKARPALFIAGCLGLGFLGARLLRK